ncbi:hypothetical protein GCM10027341_41130 [Spirosoma knui]
MNPSSLSASLGQVAIYLASRREAVLNNWRAACESDPDLKNAASLSREEFNNKVPFMLNELEHRLRGQAEVDSISLLAAEHGLHRWQKGHALEELSTEMHHLNDTLLEELRRYWEFIPSIDRQLMATAYEQLARFGNQITSASVQQYTELLRQSAANRVEVLEKTLSQLTELGQQRSILLHQSSHDLRGSFGVIQGAASLASREGESLDQQKLFMDMLQRNLANSQALVSQLIDLARLEASQEPLHIQPVEVGQLLTSLAADYQPLAQQQGLLLQVDGPTQLKVESDPLLLQRIIQNLLLNALKHTQQGFVSVSWSQESDYRWTVSVQDSGPGLPTARQTGSLPQVLAPSPESSSAFGLPNPTQDARQGATAQAASSALAHRGEGIGLTIVKGLCELLRASLEIESKPGNGTLFRIRLPIHWQS